MVCAQKYVRYTISFLWHVSCFVEWVFQKIGHTMLSCSFAIYVIHVYTNTHAVSNWIVRSNRVIKLLFEHNWRIVGGLKYVKVSAVHFHDCLPSIKHDIFISLFYKIFKIYLIHVEHWICLLLISLIFGYDEMFLRLLCNEMSCLFHLHWLAI